LSAVQWTVINNTDVQSSHKYDDMASTSNKALPVAAPTDEDAGVKSCSRMEPICEITLLSTWKISSFGNISVKERRSIWWTKRCGVHC